jgi:(1->4)-alpha-D-glucan 1-alpha-D-glucosylmutase
MSRMDCGLPKMWITHCALQLRNRKPEWFGEQAIYARLETTGPKAEHVIAFRRGENVVTCVPRWNALLGDGWGDTLISLPEGRWTNELTGEGWSGGPARMEELFRRFPVALLTGQAA